MPFQSAQQYPVLEYSYIHLEFEFFDSHVRCLYMKAVHMHTCMCLCVQTLVKPPLVAECKITMLKVRILLDVLNKFQIINPNH